MSGTCRKSNYSSVAVFSFSPCVSKGRRNYKCTRVIVHCCRSGFSRDAFEFAAKAAPTATSLSRNTFDKWYFGNFPLPKGCRNCKSTFYEPWVGFVGRDLSRQSAA